VAAARKHIFVLAFSLLAVAAFPSAAAAATETVGLGGWQVQSSAQATQGGAAISGPGFTPQSWLQVRPDDAGAPGTEVGALVQAGRCPNVFFSTNMETCFGYMKAFGRNTIPMFSVPWWFRTTFSSDLRGGQRAQLIINGVVGEADVWLNGRLLATRATVKGDLTRYTFDITRFVRGGVNALALEVYPNDPTSMFTVSHLDWSQVPPDNNTGIQFPIQLHTSGPLALSDAHVVQQDAPDFSSAALTLKGVVSNLSAVRQSGSVRAAIDGRGGGSAKPQSITLGPHSSRTVSFRVVVSHPRVWWPYQMGSQPLYGLRMSVRQPRFGADSQSEMFGIRTITTRLVGRSAIAPQGSRQFLVNGRPFVFRGGGWEEDLFLRYSAADTDAQIAMIKNLGLNGIRTEGKQMPDDFYARMDRAGILIDAGFECCDAWELQSSKLTSNHDFQVLYNSARTIGGNMRNHPSVLNFGWSDLNPTPGQERVSLGGFRQADFQDPVIASAEYRRGTTLGWSGEKEGPYSWVPPGYWYDTSHYDPSDPARTNVGGGWAFDSETSAGDTVPTLDSIKRFLSPFEQSQLWQNPGYNQYHTNYESDLPSAANGGYAFGTLYALDQAIMNRYGSWSSLGEYVEEAQLQNYETQRAEFEAYIKNSTRAKAPSTGVDYWQLNKGWPTLLWDLYNNDLDQAGSYFGAKKANESLHVLYAYDDGKVAVDNLGGATQGQHLSVEANVYGLDGTRLDHQVRNGISLGGQGVKTGVLRPNVPATTSPPRPATAYFVELILRQRGRVVDRNVYWLSTQPDVVDWAKTVGQARATMSQYADLRALKGLPGGQISAAAHTYSSRGPDGSDTATDVTITNTSSSKVAAFFVRADMRRGSAAGTPAAGDNEVLPVFWTDNDITLWPGESQSLHASYRRSDLQGASPVVTIGGWNRPTINVRG
jgi:exo-1,4-beta-D-glucosaminidase